MKISDGARHPVLSPTQFPKFESGVPMMTGLMNRKTFNQIAAAPEFNGSATNMAGDRNRVLSPFNSSLN